MQIRLAVPSDATHIASVHVRSWQGAYRGLLPDQLLDRLSVERRAAWWSEAIGVAALDVYVVLDQKESIVGFASLQLTRDNDAPPGTAELTTLYVLPDFWGKGYGRALMEAVLQKAKERGYASISLWVLESNVRARRFYEIAGFRPDGAVKTETWQGVVLPEVRYVRKVEIR